MILTEEVMAEQIMGICLKKKKKKEITLSRVEASLVKCDMLLSDNLHPRIWKKFSYKITDLDMKF